MYCGHPCTEEGDYVALADLFENPELYKDCTPVEGKCCIHEHIYTGVLEDYLI